MRANGEVFFFMNGWMNFLSLALCARLARVRLRWGRGLAAALLGGGYALIAWGCWPVLRRMPALLLCSAGMAALAFGRRGWRLGAFVWAAGLMLSGLSRLLNRYGMPPGGQILACGGAVLLLGRLLAGKGRQWAGRGVVRIQWRGREAALPALVDSGNLLRDGLTGLPVIVAPGAALGGLLPPEVNPGDTASLQSGLRLIRVRTAAGEKTLMCFHPDGVELRLGRARRWTDAVVALSGAALPRALVPTALLDEKEG